MGNMDRNKLMVVAMFCAALRFGDAFGRFIKEHKTPLFFVLGFLVGFWAKGLL